MRSWRALPSVPLTGGGAYVGAFEKLVVRTLREAAHWVGQLPYGRTTAPTPEAVLREGRGTCSTKHALLAALAAECGVALQLTVGVYEMDGANTPGTGPVLAAHGLKCLPEAHCYVVYDGVRVDVTRPEPPQALDILKEWAIRPDQIGAHKAALHRRYLRGWLAKRGDVAGSLDEAWAIREACIAALALAPR